ncbi:MAG TPA: thymidine kinase [Gemmatimonadota bacterium]|nr:thymidine kinase [Gemmatimonadota bacterium]
MTAFVRGPVGWVEVICGPMFSGKSEELIRRLRRAEIARQRVQVFKPVIDDRYGQDEIVSHSAQRITASNVRSAREILEGVDPRTQVVGIDEAHFYDDEIASVVERLANVGKRVIVAGLDLDYLGEPFDHVTRLLAQAEEITKTLAICVRCGNPASRTQRLVPSEERIVVGGSRAYEARCRQCFEPRLAQAELPLEERARSRKAGQ